MELRDYQFEAVERVLNDWECGYSKCLVVMATGLGKTVVFSHIAMIRAMRHGGRVLILAHRDKLLKQAEVKIYLATVLRCNV